MRGFGFQNEKNAKDVRLNGRLAQQTISEYVQYIGRDSNSDWAHHKKMDGLAERK